MYIIYIHATIQAKYDITILKGEKWILKNSKEYVRFVTIQDLNPKAAEDKKEDSMETNGTILSYLFDFTNCLDTYIE